MPSQLVTILMITNFFLLPFFILGPTFILATLLFAMSEVSQTVSQFTFLKKTI